MYRNFEAMVGGGLLLGSSSAPVKEDHDEAIELLPPGFRFHPTDEEIIMHYLLEKAVDRGFTARAISEADLNKCEPWDLPDKAKMGEKEWFFFFQRDRKYPTGMRTNRATESGYWKATGKDKEIYYKPKNYLVGMKKTLVFYKGRAPKGDKTNWVMHEYRLEGDHVTNYNISRAAKEEFVVCRVFHKSTGIKRPPPGLELARINDHSFVERLPDSHTLPPLVDYTNWTYNIEGPCSSYATHEDDRSKELISGNSSSRVFLNNHQLPYPQYYDPRSYFVPPQDTTNTVLNPSFYPQIAIPTSVFPYQAQTSQHGEGLAGSMSSYPPNVFPFKGGHDRENLRLMTPRMEQFFSSNNSVISHSEETGLSTENVESKGDVESKNIKLFDDQELERLGFSPGISDLDSLWSYC